MSQQLIHYVIVYIPFANILIDRMSSELSHNTNDNRITSQIHIAVCDTTFSIFLIKKELMVNIL